MSGRSCLKNEKNSQLNLHKENIRGVLPFAAGATLTRNQRIFLKGRYLISGALLFLFFSLIGCSPSQEELQKNLTSCIAIIQIDSCEYIMIRGSYGSGICHKQNCKHCTKKLIIK